MCWCESEPCRPGGVPVVCFQCWLSGVRRTPKMSGERKGRGVSASCNLAVKGFDSSSRFSQQVSWRKTVLDPSPERAAKV